MQLKKKLSIQIVLCVSLAISFIFFMGIKNRVLADSHKPTAVVASYSLSSVDLDTLMAFETMEGVSMSTYNGTLTVKMILPETDEINDSTKFIKTKVSSSKDSSDYNEISFSDMIESMDNSNGNENIPEGTPINSDGTVNILGGIFARSGKSYTGQDSGDKVKKGTHVHCNRFNGTSSDHTYWGKFNPKALKDFYHSDCDYHALKYGCSSIGKMSKCDGLNGKGHGVKDCSAWSGKGHHNWPKTAWYRN